MEGVGAHSNKHHVNGAVQYAARSVNHFKVDPPKLFNGQTINGTALKPWLYQMNLNLQLKTSLPENLLVTQAPLLLTGNTATWFQA